MSKSLYRIEGLGIEERSAISLKPKQFDDLTRQGYTLTHIGYHARQSWRMRLHDLGGWWEDRMDWLFIYGIDDVSIGIHKLVDRLTGSKERQK